MESQLKTVLVGDGAVGKTSLVMEFANPGSSNSSEYIPTVFDNYQFKQVVNGSSYCVGLWDTAGREDFDRLRPLYYPNTDLFILCFAVNNRYSFNSIDKYVAEVTHHCPDVPKLLVGLKCELN